MAPRYPLHGTLVSSGPCSQHLSVLPSGMICDTGVSPGNSKRNSRETSEKLLDPFAREFGKRTMKAAFLPDRGVVKVSGEGARDFLNGLFTTDVTLLRPGLGRFGALLTPQGKITTDFLITEAPSGHGGGFLIDCPRALAQALADKLGFYKLRAKVEHRKSVGQPRRARGVGRRPRAEARSRVRRSARRSPRLADSCSPGARAKSRRSDRRGNGR